MDNVYLVRSGYTYIVCSLLDVYPEAALHHSSRFKQQQISAKLGDSKFLRVPAGITTSSVSDSSNYLPGCARSTILVPATLLEGSGLLECVIVVSSLIWDHSDFATVARSVNFYVTHSGVFSTAKRWDYLTDYYMVIRPPPTLFYPDEPHVAEAQTGTVPSVPRYSWGHSSSMTAETYFEFSNDSIGLILVQLSLTMGGIPEHSPSRIVVSSTGQFFKFYGSSVKNGWPDRPVSVEIGAGAVSGAPERGDVRGRETGIHFYFKID